MTREEVAESETVLIIRRKTEIVTSLRIAYFTLMKQELSILLQNRYKNRFVLVKIIVNFVMLLIVLMLLFKMFQFQFQFGSLYT